MKEKSEADFSDGSLWFSVMLWPPTVWPEKLRDKKSISFRALNNKKKLYRDAWENSSCGYTNDNNNNNNNKLRLAHIGLGCWTHHTRSENNTVFAFSLFLAHGFLFSGQVFYFITALMDLSEGSNNTPSQNTPALKQDISPYLIMMDYLFLFKASQICLLIGFRWIDTMSMRSVSRHLINTVLVAEGCVTGRRKSIAHYVYYTLRSQLFCLLPQWHFHETMKLWHFHETFPWSGNPDYLLSLTIGLSISS